MERRIGFGREERAENSLYDWADRGEYKYFSDFYFIGQVGGRAVYAKNMVRCMSHM